jgi:ubiquinol-cytochrome c reductase cytochrome b subunit
VRGWGRALGGALAVALALQALTGWLMATYYAPSSTTAWASVAYIQQEVTLGWFIRGLHSMGATLVVVLVLAHLVHAIASGAYATTLRRNWLVGIVLLGLVLAFALTGYLLPWDQKGYWATQVATSLVGETPFVGDFARRVLQGGGDYGNLTLTHFYAVHAMLLPALTATLVVVHLRWSRRAATTPWWPDEAWRDAIAGALVISVAYALVGHTHGAPLEAPADPSSQYDARPEWYFVPLFQLLKYFPGRLETVGALGTPLVLGALLVALPTAPRRPAVMMVGAVLAAALALGVRAKLDDARNVAYQKGRARADADARRALELARKGVPPAGGMAVYENDPLVRARRIFGERCAGCHVLEGSGEEKGPLLTGWSSRAWLTDFLTQPDAPRYFGRSKKLHGMKPVKVEGEELRALVEWIYAQGGGSFDKALADRGLAIYHRENCDDCHAEDGKSEGVEGAPNFAGRGTTAWIARIIRDGSEPMLFSDRNEMPKFGPDKLADDDVAALAALIAAQR